MPGCWARWGGRRRGGYLEGGFVELRVELVGLNEVRAEGADLAQLPFQRVALPQQRFHLR